MKNYAAYVSGKGTRIKKAIINNSKLKDAFKCVITDEEYDKELEEFCLKNEICYYTLDYKKLDKQQDRNLLFSDYLCEKLKQHDIDYCFTFGGHILKGNLLNEYENKLVNFHPGIIPDIIGLHAIDKAIEEKKRYIGNTVHFIDSGVDSGPIIMQNVMLSENFELYGYDAILDEQVNMIYMTFELLETNRIIIKDNNAIIEGADYTISNIYPRFSL